MFVSRGDDFDVSDLILAHRNDYGQLGMTGHYVHDDYKGLLLYETNGSSLDTPRVESRLGSVDEESVSTLQWIPSIPPNKHQIQHAPTRANTPNQHTPPSPSQRSQGGEVAPIRNRRIPPAAKNLLEESFERHRQNPYIPEDEIHTMVELTGLTLRQIRTFFSNARARRLPPVSVSAQSRRRGVDANNQRGAKGIDVRQGLSSPLEGEAFAVACTQAPVSLQLERQRRSSTTLSTSASSVTSIDPLPLLEAPALHTPSPRRGRRRQMEKATRDFESLSRKSSSPSRKFQCTFCTLDFAHKYDWQRHEDSVHFPQKEWVCLPNGPLDDGLNCVFCGKYNPEKKHLDSHKSIACAKTPHHHRTFLRKDKLIQHIKQVHSCQPPKTITLWCRPIKWNVIMMCGFCMRTVPDWNTRTEHIASHFSDGIGMDKWVLEQPGGVLTPNAFPSTTYISTPSPNGQFACNLCPTHFTHMRNLVIHRRQTHGTFDSEDASLLHPPEPMLTNTTYGELTHTGTFADVLNSTQMPLDMYGHPKVLASYPYTNSTYPCFGNLSASTSNILTYPLQGILYCIEQQNDDGGTFWPNP